MLKTKKTMRIGLVLFSLLMVNCTPNNQKKAQKIDLTNIGNLPKWDWIKKYDLQLPVSKDKNDVFSDSLFFEWNKSAAAYVKKQINETQDSCLITSYLLNEKGSNFRLNFAKTVNKFKLITRDDFEKTFYVVERTTSGVGVGNYSSLIKSNDDLTDSVFVFVFSNMDATWELMRQKEIRKHDIDRFFYSIVGQKVYSEYPNTHTTYFNVFQFTTDSITSYLSSCRYRDVFAIEVFQNLIN